MITSLSIALLLKDKFEAALQSCNMIMIGNTCQYNYRWRVYSAAEYRSMEMKMLMFEGVLFDIGLLVISGSHITRGQGHNDSQYVKLKEKLTLSAIRKSIN
jgi:hypothetical protein